MTTINLGRVVGQNGADGEDGRGIVSIEKTATQGLVDTYTITYTDGTTSTFEVTNGESGGGGTSNYNELTNKPSINGVELSGSKSLSDLDIQEKLVSGTNIKTINGANILGSGNIVIEGGDTPASVSEEVDFSPYLYPEYTQGGLTDTGELDTTKTAYVTNFLPVVPNEKLLINKICTDAICYYDINEVFISKVNTTSGLNEYTVPENAKLARFQNAYSGGQVRPLNLRPKDLTGFYKNFYDVLVSPHFTNPKIQFTGDSNTVGYGLASGDKSWANLFIDELTQLTSKNYSCYDSIYVNSIGATEYGGSYNFRPGSYTEIYTNATEVTFGYANSYSGAWKWYVDGVEQVGSDNQTSLTDLDGNHHTIRVSFTAGQVVGAKFTIPKTVTCVNNAVSGTGYSNVTIADGYDWTFLMIGTNDRNRDYVSKDSKIYKLRGKATYIYPFPNHKQDSSYTCDQWFTYSMIANLFKGYGFDVINCCDVAGGIFVDNTYYQNDKIHYNANGHKVICNIISGKLGLPTYFEIS